MNCCNFFLSEFEETKSRIYRVKKGKRWDGTVVVLASSVHTAAGGNFTFYDQEVCKKHYLTTVSNHYLMLTLQTAGLRFYNGKSVIVKSWNRVTGKKPRYRYLSSGIRLISCWRETLSVLDVFSNNTKIVNCNRRHSFSQYNEFSNVFQRKSKVYLQPQWFSN